MVLMSGGFVINDVVWEFHETTLYPELVSVKFLLAEIGIIPKIKRKQRNSPLPNHTVFLYDVSCDTNK